MKYQQAGGFTIIEVMLFLAITGMMVVGVLLAVSGSINYQRYTDAVNSFHDYLQSQYTITSNVRNNRPAQTVCDQAGGIRETIDTTAVRGTSNCTIIGRYIRTDGTGSEGRRIIASPVYATRDITETVVQSPSPGATVADQLQALGLTLGPSIMQDDTQTHEMAWQTNIFTDRNNPTSSGAFAMLIVRMPTDGITRTYTRIGAPPQTDLMRVVNEAQTAAVQLCVNPSGLTAAPANGVRILPNAINTNSIQFVIAGAGC